MLCMLVIDAFFNHQSLIRNRYRKKCIKDQVIMAESMGYEETKLQAPPRKDLGHVMIESAGDRNGRRRVRGY